MPCMWIAQCFYSLLTAELHSPMLCLKAMVIIFKAQYIFYFSVFSTDIIVLVILS